MLRRVKLICSNDSLFFREVDILQLLFLAEIYPARFFDKILQKFFAFLSPHTQKNENGDKCESCFLKVPYIGLTSKQFRKSLSELISLS